MASKKKGEGRDKFWNISFWGMMAEKVEAKMDDENEGVVRIPI